jgi:hypothetical protein
MREDILTALAVGFFINASMGTLGAAASLRRMFVPGAIPTHKKRIAYRVAMSRD